MIMIGKALEVHTEIIEYPAIISGNRNLVGNSDLHNNFTPWGAGNSSKLLDGYIRADSSGSGTSFGIQQLTEDRIATFKDKTTYTLSFMARGNIDKFDYCYLMRVETGNLGLAAVNTKLTNQWQLIQVEVTTNGWSTNKGFVLIGTRDVAPGKYFEIKDIKVEVGKYTSFSVNPQDIGYTPILDKYVPTFNEKLFLIPEFIEKVNQTAVVSLNEKFMNTALEMEEKING